MPVRNESIEIFGVFNYLKCRKQGAEGLSTNQGALLIS